jgi:hypothetical protein
LLAVERNKKSKSKKRNELKKQQPKKGTEGPSSIEPQRAPLFGHTAGPSSWLQIALFFLRQFLLLIARAVG